MSDPADAGALTEAAGPGRRRPPVPGRRPAFYLAVATAGALAVNVLGTSEPTATADAASLESVSVAEQLGVSADPSNAPFEQLEQLAASRSERDAAAAAAAQAQAAAEQAERDRQAAEQAAAEEEAEAAAAAPGSGTNAPVAPSGSYQDYAMGKLGGDSGQFSCLESLWGKESGWNPNAQNPTSTAYGIPQFLDSTWASTGIAKTSDGYRQIDAGLIYIENRYGSPCAAWSHSQANNWY
jgi:hypothetical protein